MRHTHNGIDLLQVDLLASGVSLFAAKRPTGSDEVARGRLVSLAGFSFTFRAKNGEWRDSHLGFQVSYETTPYEIRRRTLLKV